MVGEGTSFPKALASELLWREISEPELVLPLQILWPGFSFILGANFLRKGVAKGLSSVVEGASMVRRLIAWLMSASHRRSRGPVTKTVTAVTQSEEAVHVTWQIPPTWRNGVFRTFQDTLDLNCKALRMLVVISRIDHFSVLNAMP